ncbi:MAG: multidrug efflux SMR transporter [Clostridia bacterium]|nr:multidrug efflux SMR transporter [Deltaproteobacteria bacterium]
MAWILLLVAGLFEISFTTSLRFVNNFKNIPATVAFVAFANMSLLFLELTSRSIPLGTSYAIWTGLGALGTVIIGMMWFNEPASLIRGVLIFGIVGCAVGLKVTSGK